MEYQKRAWFSAITENTGSHFLDSGSAYGRHWQRNAGLVRESAFDWDNRLTVAGYGWEVTTNVLHYLTQNYHIDRVQTSRFHRFALSEQYRDDRWYDCLRAYVEDRGGRMFNGDNTCNHENWLSQEVLTWRYENARGDDYVAVSVHTGCDVRGGYSRPFLCKEDDCEWTVGLTDAWMTCRSGHCWFADGASHWICDRPYKTVRSEAFKVRANRYGYWLACPICHKKVDC